MLKLDNSQNIDDSFNFVCEHTSKTLIKWGEFKNIIYLEMSMIINIKIIIAL